MVPSGTWSSEKELYRYLGEAGNHQVIEATKLGEKIVIVHFLFIGTTIEDVPENIFGAIKQEQQRKDRVYALILENKSIYFNQSLKNS